MEKKLYIVHTDLQYVEEMCISTNNIVTYNYEEAEAAFEKECASWFTSDGIFWDYDPKSKDFDAKLGGIPAECRDMNGERYAICDIETVVFNTLVFTFSAEVYTREDVEKMTMEECHGFAMNDPQNVRKYSESIQSLINGDLIDTENCWVRVIES